MFKPLRAAATLPAQDLQRAKAFYRDKLGLSPTVEDPALGLIYELAAGSGFGLVIAGGQDTAGAQNPVGAFPEVS